MMIMKGLYVWSFKVRSIPMCGIGFHVSYWLSVGSDPNELPSCFIIPSRFLEGYYLVIPCSPVEHTELPISVLKLQSLCTCILMVYVCPWCVVGYYNACSQQLFAISTPMIKCKVHIVAYTTKPATSTVDS